MQKFINNEHAKEVMFSDANEESQQKGTSDVMNKREEETR